jgi:hypothetical protein
MKLSLCAILAATASLVSAQSTSISTTTSTRTVLRVYTQTMTGTPNITSWMPTAYSSTSYGGKNGTSIATSGSSSPTIQTYSPTGTSGASHDAVNFAVAAIVGGAALLVL